MIKDVLIKINANMGSDEKTDTMELITEGKFGYKDSEYFLIYDESEMLGVDNVKTSIFIKDADSVVLQRTGGLESRIIIKKGIRNLCHYSIPQGEIVIGIFGETIDYNLSSSGGEISLVYTIDSNLKFISRNRVNISISEVN